MLISSCSFISVRSLLLTWSHSPLRRRSIHRPASWPAWRRSSSVRIASTVISRLVWRSTVTTALWSRLRSRGIRLLASVSSVAIAIVVIVPIILVSLIIAVLRRTLPARSLRIRIVVLSGRRRPLRRRSLRIRHPQSDISTEALSFASPSI